MFTFLTVHFYADGPSDPSWHPLLRSNASSGERRGIVDAKEIIALESETRLTPIRLNG
jgi:hypothetical protein